MCLLGDRVSTFYGDIWREVLVTFRTTSAFKVNLIRSHSARAGVETERVGIRTIISRVCKVAQSAYYLNFFRLSVGTYQHGSHWTDFHEIWYCELLRKSDDRLKIWLISNKNNRPFTCRITQVLLFQATHTDTKSFLWHTQYFCIEWDIYLNNTQNALLRFLYNNGYANPAQRHVPLTVQSLSSYGQTVDGGV
jgi:hypothetical protein